MNAVDRLQLMNSFVDEIKRVKPELYRKAYPRPYQNTQIWYSPKYLSILVAESLLEKSINFKKDGINVDSCAVATYYTVARLLEFNVPTYFVAPDLLAALTQTDLPSTIALNELRWPLDAILFVLPKKSLFSPSGEVLYLAVARNIAGSRSIILSDDSGEYLTTSFDAITTFAYCANATCYSWSHPINKDLVIDVKNDPIHKYYAFDDNLVVNDNLMVVTVAEKELPQDEIEFVKVHHQLAIKLMLAMVAKPELIKEEIVIKSPRTIKGNYRPGIFSPNILGFNYKIQHERREPVGTHATPRTHWRRGFLRHYVPGEGLPWKKQQTIWIEPILVLAQKNEN